MGWLTLAAIAALSGAGAQDAMVVTPRVETIDIEPQTADVDPTPLSEREPPKELKPFRAIFQTQCGNELPFATIDDEETWRLTLTRSSKGISQFNICDDRVALARSVEIKDLSMALTVLSFKAFEPLWSTAESHWGSDLSKLREQVRKQSRAGGQTLHGPLIKRSTDKVRSRALKLATIGEWRKSLELINARLAKVSTNRRLKSEDQALDRQLLATSRSAILSNQVGPEAALESLDDYLTLNSSDGRYGTNIQINRAAFLAEAGRFREAIEVIEPAYELYKQPLGDASSYRISGSDRQFSWILACGYHGLGRTGDAEPHIELVMTAEPNPRDPYLGQTVSSAYIQLRLASCMNDRDLYLETLFGGAFPALSPHWLQLQPNAPDRIYAWRAEWDIPSGIKDRYAEKYRNLPYRFAPALRRWPGNTDSGQEKPVQ
ncbi:MAG: hypothetical protein AAGK02_11270 [Pseudomonadota bacterium]